MSRRRRKEKERIRQIKLQRTAESRNKMCGGKKQFDNLTEAEGYGRMYSDPRWGKLHSRSDLRAYLCPHCDKFHLTDKAKVRN
jgi:hypothetical protein